MSSEQESLEQLDALIDELEAKVPAKASKKAPKKGEIVDPEYLRAPLYKGHDHGFVRTVDEWNELIAKCVAAGVCGFDIETTGKDVFKEKMHGFSLAWAPGCARYVFWEFVEQNRELVIATFTKLKVVTHAGKYDFHFLKEFLPEIFVAVEQMIESDTIIMLHLDDPDQRHPLKASIWKILKIRMMTLFECLGVKEEDLEKDRVQIDFNRVPLERLCQYGCGDADLTLQLYFHEAKRIRPDFQRNEGIDALLQVPVLVDMERRGILIDKPYLQVLAPMFERCVVRMHKTIYEVVGHPFDLNSPKQVRQVLFDEMKLTPLKYTKKTGAASTTADDLAKLAKRSDNEVLNWIVEAKSHQHSLSAYVKGTLEGSENRDGCLHAEYLPCVAPTYRLACVTGKIGGGGLNVQQIPKEPEYLEVELADEERERLQAAGVEVIPTDTGTFKVVYNARRPYLARPGFYMVSADYQAIEFRLLVNFSGEAEIGHAIRNGEDAHMKVSTIMYRKPKEEVTKSERDYCKTLNYGLAYGMSPWALAARLDITEEMATTLYNTYFQTFQNIRRYIKGVQMKARRDGFVMTYWGRRRYVEREYQTGGMNRGDRSSINTVIQGSAADVMRFALVRTYFLMRDKYGDKVHMIATLHDQILFEVANDIVLEEFVKDVRAGMELDNPSWLCPLVVDVSYGQNWGQLKDLKKKSEMKAKKKRAVCQIQEVLVDELRVLVDSLPAGDMDFVMMSKTGTEETLRKVMLDKTSMTKMVEALGEEAVQISIEDVNEPKPAEPATSS